MKNWDSMFLLAGPLEGWKLCQRDNTVELLDAAGQCRRSHDALTIEGARREIWNMRDQAYQDADAGLLK